MKNKVYKLSLNNGGVFYFTMTPDDMLHEFDWGNVGDKFTVEIVEMTDEEYENVLEFDGF